MKDTIAPLEDCFPAFPTFHEWCEEHNPLTSYDWDRLEAADASFVVDGHTVKHVCGWSFTLSDAHYSELSLARAAARHLKEKHLEGSAS